MKELRDLEDLTINDVQPRKPFYYQHGRHVCSLAEEVSAQDLLITDY